MASIFFSYRKQGEDKLKCLRLADDFRAALDDDEIFRDEMGLKINRFEDQLLNHGQSCKLIVAIIGPTWISRIADLHKENAWVRRELERIGNSIASLSPGERKTAVASWCGGQIGGRCV